MPHLQPYDFDFDMFLPSHHPNPKTQFTPLSVRCNSSNILSNRKQVYNNGGPNPPHSNQPPPPPPSPHHFQAPLSIPLPPHPLSTSTNNNTTQPCLTILPPRCSRNLLRILSKHVLSPRLPPRQHGNPLRTTANSMDSRANGEIQPRAPTRVGDLNPIFGSNSIREEFEGIGDGDTESERYYC